MKLKIHLRSLLLIACILTAVILIAGYFYLPNTDPYKWAIAFIEKNEKVNFHLGNIVDHRPSFMGWSGRHSGPRGPSEFEVQVTGFKAKGIVYVNLTKRVGGWKVVQSNLILENGTVIPLVEAHQGK